MAATAAPQSTVAPATAPSTRRAPKRHQSWIERLARKRGPGLLAFIAFLGIWQLLSSEHPERAELAEPIPAAVGAPRRDTGSADGGVGV